MLKGFRGFCFGTIDVIVTTAPFRFMHGDLVFHFGLKSHCYIADEAICIVKQSHAFELPLFPVRPYLYRVHTFAAAVSPLGSITHIFRNALYFLFTTSALPCSITSLTAHAAPSCGLPELARCASTGTAKM